MTASRALRDRLRVLAPTTRGGRTARELVTGRRHDAELVACVLSRTRQDVLDKLERIFARRSASRAAVRSAGELSRRLRRRLPLSYFTAPFWFTTTSRTPRSSGGVGRRC